MKKNKILFITGLLLIVLACKEDRMGSGSKGSERPEPPENIRVERLPGATKITYDIPNDENLLYVKAEVVIGGQVRERKSSIFKNFLILDGFADTTVCDVTLTTASKSGLLSSPVKIQVQAGEPPISTIIHAISLDALFGGVGVKFSNEHEAEVSINVIRQDSLNAWVDAGVLYTRQKEGVFSTRGFAAQPQLFGVYIEDRWGNRSDTVQSEITPLFEERLDETSFRSLMLPTDMPVGYGWAGVPGLWDGSTALLFGYHTLVGSGMPQWFSMDLGVKAKLSRIKVFQRTDTDLAYALGNPKVFEIWGSNNPDPDGGWENWKKLMVCTATKPSGSPIGTNTSEDIAFALAGEDFDFPLDAEPVRYIRFKTLETWSRGDFVHLVELQYWGTVLE